MSVHIPLLPVIVTILPELVQTPLANTLTERPELTVGVMLKVVPKIAGLAG